MVDKFTRVRAIFAENFDHLREKKILLLGVGGVGGFCLDALYRSGIENITIVDFDKFEITNQNRQIGSEHIGQTKVFVFKKLYPKVTPIDVKVTPSWVDEFNFDKFDLVIDAIDDIDAKVATAQKTYSKLISSMGGAKKLDPTQIEIRSIWKTYGDGLAKKFRNELKKVNFNKKFDVVFSPEEPKCKDLGSFVGVTGAFGLTLASLAIKKLAPK